MQKELILFFLLALTSIAKGREGFRPLGLLPDPLKNTSSSVLFLTAQKDRSIKGRGTGFILCHQNKKYLITAWHVVENSCHQGFCSLGLEASSEWSINQNFQLTGPRENQWSPGSLALISKSHSDDVAVLKLPKDFEAEGCLDPASLEEEKEDQTALQKHMRIFALGFPYLVHRPRPYFTKKIKKLYSSGFVRSIRNSRYPKSRVISNDALPGMSGSPVLDAQGKVLGVIHRIFTYPSIPEPGDQGFEIIKYSGITVVTPIEVIIGLLDREKDL